MVMDVFWYRLSVRMIGDLFVRSWTMVRRLMRGSISSALIMYYGGVRIILLLPLVARCLETIDMCIWHMFFIYVCCRECVGICVNVCCVVAVVKDIVYF